MGMQLELLKAQKENIEADTKKKIQDTSTSWQQGHEIELRNIIQEVLQANDEYGKPLVNADVYGSAAAKKAFNEILMQSKTMDEIGAKIQLMKKQGDTEEVMQKKLENEVKILQNEIDWQGLNITEENKGKVLWKIIKQILK